MEMRGQQELSARVDWGLCTMATSHLVLCPARRGGGLSEALGEVCASKRHSTGLGWEGILLP